MSGHFHAFGRQLVAVDPGDEHVGVAVFRYSDACYHGVCEGVLETTPNEFLDGFAEDLVAGTYDALVYERFLLRPDLALEQSGSEMLTSQMIGALSWMVRIHNKHARGHLEADRPNSGLTLDCTRPGGVCADSEKPRARLLQVGAQLPAVQEVAAGHLRARGTKSLAKKLKAGPHCLSAELHGYHWLETQQRRMEQANQVDTMKGRVRK